MKRIIPMALIALTLSGGVALADRGRGRDTSHRQGGTVVTPTHRYNRGGDRRVDHRRYDNRRYDNRRHDNRRHDRVVRVQRSRPTFRNDRFYFAGGFYRPYTRPVINVRYRDYYRRPALVVENVQPVTGYLWIPGTWNWSGYEWIWQPGHYEIDASYQDSYFEGGYYDTNGAFIQGSVSGSWNF